MPENSKPAVTVRPVKSRSDLKQFIDLPWSIYRESPHWAPPIKSSVAKLLNRKKHPFWHFSEGELFLAEREGRVVGRIGAIIDNNSNNYHNEKVGVWGFFECFNDGESSTALFSAATAWAEERGMVGMRGPLNPSTNYEIGALIKGFEHAPALMMSYNPPYYPELIHKAGFRKEKDILSYRITRSYTPPSWFAELSEKITEQNDISVHCPKKWTRENISLMCSIYNDCWADNWGFVPMTEAEEDEMAKELLFLIEPELAFFIYCREEPVGIGLLLPDFNPLLKRFNGSLGLTALVKKYLYMSEVIGLRGMLFGIRNNYRQMGLHLVAIQHVLTVVKSIEMYQYAELGWTLEDNEAINNLFQESGVAPEKRYRIYKKDLLKKGTGENPSQQ